MDHFLCHNVSCIYQQVEVHAYITKNDTWKEGKKKNSSL
jgi:hypothetical protein